MGAARLVNAWPVIDPAAFGVLCTVIEPVDPRKSDGSGTHGTGFERNPKRASDQALGFQLFTGATERQHLSMGRWVIAGTGLVSRLSDNVAIGRDDNGADRHFVPG